MVWLTEKKIVHHVLDLGGERVKIPIRVKFEFEIREGSYVPGSLSTRTLYNKNVLEKRYPQLDSASLDLTIDDTVKKELANYLKEHGFLSESSD